MIKQGVYEIKNRINNKKYIGSSADIKTRIRKHKSSLDLNNHYSKKLQEDWNDYGEHNFEFNIIEIVTDKNALNTREGFWINLNKSNQDCYGYNINSFDENGNLIVADSVKKKIKDVSIFQDGERHPNARFTKDDIINITARIDKGELVSDLSEEYQTDTGTIYKIAKNEVWKSVKRKSAKIHHHDKKLTEEDVIDIKLSMQDNISTRELADRYNVHLDTIYSIKQGINWSHVLPTINLSESNTRLAPKRKKLHRDQVVQIKIKLEQGELIKSIADEFNVTTRTVYDIKNEKYWADIII